MRNEESSLSPNNTNIQQHHHRLQLLAQAVEKVESECTQKRLPLPISHPSKQQHPIPLDTLSMATSTLPQQELLMQFFAQPNLAAVMAAAAAAAQYQAQQQQQKLEPISPPSTSSASSSVESPIDFSSRRSTDDMNECLSPPSLSPNQQLLSPMLQNLQSNNTFPFLLTNKNGKPTRPFKAYPREPLMLPLGFCPNTTSEQNNLLLDAMARTTSNRKRLAQTQERFKQRLQQQQQQQSLNTTHFISSSGAQILQPPKKRHRMMENSVINEEKTTTTIKDNHSEGDNGIKDEAYWERRRKNNEAAKRSRDARRAKEDEIALR